MKAPVRADGGGDDPGADQLPEVPMSEESKRLHVLRDYAAGRLGTREAIQRAGLDDYADLIIALVQHDLDLPKPADTPQRRAHLERAAAVLQPLLRRKPG